jgi:GNAT superfamily N-acetyltransferase
LEGLLDRRTGDGVKIQRLRDSAYDALDHVADGVKPDPRSTITGVVTDDKGEIIGRIFLMSPAHVEGVWVREDLRKQGVFTDMVRWVEQQARSIGISKVFAYGADAYMDRQIERLGYTKQPLTVWTKEI